MHPINFYLPLLLATLFVIFMFHFPTPPLHVNSPNPAVLFAHLDVRNSSALSPRLQRWLHPTGSTSTCLVPECLTIILSTVGKPEQEQQNVAVQWTPARRDDETLDPLPTHEHVQAALAHLPQSVVPLDLSGRSRPLHLLHTDEPLVGEYPTLGLLHAYCSANPRSIVAYVHSKGTHSHGCWHDERGDCVRDWRRYLEYLVVDRGPSECGVRLGAGLAVACGPNLVDEPPGRRHFSGNMWWAHCAHVRTLPPPRPGTDGFVHTATFELDRMDAELWLNPPQLDVPPAGDARSPSVVHPLRRSLAMHCSHTHHYTAPYPPNMYEDRPFGAGCDDGATA